jgi:hypothetical protein
VSNPSQLGAIRITSKAPDGTALGEPQTYDFSQGIPAALKDSCVIQRILTCRNVQTDARRAGAYMFELALLSKQHDGEVMNAAVANVRIDPTQSRIVYFRINGQDAPSTKYLVAIAPNLTPNPLTLSWQVVGGNNMKVELLPSPGEVRPTGYLNYPVSREPSSTTLTLKVTNEAGEAITRSVVIETYIQTPTATGSPLGTLPNLPPLPSNNLTTIPVPATPITLPPPILTPPGPTSPGAANSGAASGAANGAAAGAAQPSPSDPDAPAPTDPQQLSPTELPPQFN